jgi:hypothetical protein
MAEAEGVFLLDGEDAGSTPWEFGSLTQEGSNIFALDAAAADHGSYGYRASFDGTNEGCYATKSYTNQTDLYFRFYVRINSGFNCTEEGEVTLLSWYVGGSITARITIYASGSTTPNRFIYYVDWAGQKESSTGFAIGSWIRVEVRLVVHASTGGMLVWVNGTQIVDAKLALTYNTSDYAHNTLYVGNRTGLAVPGSGDSIDFDDIKCDTSPIGEYAEYGGAPETLRVLTSARWR